MTAVVLSTTSAVYETHHRSRSASKPPASTATAIVRTRGGTHPLPGGGGAGPREEEEEHQFVPTPGGLLSRREGQREPLSAVDPNMSTRRQAKVVVDYNEAGSGKGKGGAGVNGTRTATTTGKRKAVSYEEDIEGFQFSRATQPKKSRPSPPAPEPTNNVSSPPSQPAQRGRGRPAKKDATSSKPKHAPETSNGRTAEDQTGQRRSKRLADDVSSTPVAKQHKSRRKADATKATGDDESGVVTHTQHAETKIALPMADTPVMRKNKEMRQEKGRKSGGGQRRSSLGMRGRRASSLIDSGVSNALPHDAVDTADFYKHIEGEGLPEPRRMKQLLTWCATRALGKKPSGSRSEDESARLAARVIQEELLKDIGSRSELSDWFGREETTPPPVVVKKPNPKNVQNADKIKELEEHIQKLQSERQSLAALLRAPSIPRLTSPPQASDQQQTESSSVPMKPESIDASLLDPSQQSLLAILNEPLLPSKQKPHRQQHRQTPAEEQQKQELQQNTIDTHPTPTSVPAISSKLSSLELTPSLDSLAAGMHDVELYRRAADGLASSILKTCARRLEERDLGRSEGRLESGESKDGADDSGGDGKEKKTEAPGEREDLRVVLGALSRLERR